MPSIGLAMIVKDAEQTVARALHSAKRICSGMIVVDTGSSDNTSRICRKLGAEVHFFQWTGSFSEARNYSLSLMRTDWILVLDADEEIDPGSFRDNIALLEKEKAGGISCEIENIMQDSRETTIYRHRYTRIFRNLRKYYGNTSLSRTFHFKGRVHEQIADSVTGAGFEIIPSSVTIRHYGYAMKNEDKINRNKAMLEEEIEDKPGDDWLKYHLAETEFAASDFEKSRDIYRSIAESPALSSGQKEKVRLRLAQIALKYNEFEEVAKYTSFKSEDKDREGFRRFILGISLLAAKNISAAEKELFSKDVENSDLVDKSRLMQTREILKALKAAMK